MDEHRHSSMGPIAAFLFVFLFALIAASASVLWSTPRDGPMQFASVDLPDLPKLSVPKAS